MAEKEMFLLNKRLIASVARLQKILERNAPSSIIANEIMLLFSFALAMYPNDIGKVFGSLLGGTTRAFYGVCKTCKSDLEAPLKESQCIACRLKDEIEYGE